MPCIWIPDGRRGWGPTTGAELYFRFTQTLYRWNRRKLLATSETFSPTRCHRFIRARWDVRIANSFAYISTSLLRALEVSDLERRLEALSGQLQPCQAFIVADD